MKRFFVMQSFQNAFLIACILSCMGSVFSAEQAVSVVGQAQTSAAPVAQPVVQIPPAQIPVSAPVAPVQVQASIPAVTVAPTPAATPVPAVTTSTATSAVQAQIASAPAVAPVTTSAVVTPVVQPVGPSSNPIAVAPLAIPAASSSAVQPAVAQVAPAQAPAVASTAVQPAVASVATTTPIASSQPVVQVQDQQVAQSVLVQPVVQNQQDTKAEEQQVQQMTRSIRYGDRIILKHAKTGMRLFSRQGYNFTHKGSSGQQVVACNSDKMNMSHYWLVKGPHGTARDYKFGQMVQPGDTIRLEHFASKRNLHSDAATKAPSGNNQEVYCLIKGQGDENCNWIAQNGLNIDMPVSLKHQKTSTSLRCDATPLAQDKRLMEVSTAATADDGINWVVERSVATPRVYSGSLEVLFGRGGNLSSADARYIKDVTNLLKTQVRGNRLNLPLAGQKSSLDSIGLARENADDKRGLLFVYRLAGEIFVSLSNEFDPIAAPNNNKAISLMKSGQGLGSGFRLLRALYGDLNKVTGDRPPQVYDVTKRVQGLVSGGKIEFAEGSKSVTFGFDPAKGKTKALLVFYKVGRKIYARFIADLDKATIDAADPAKEAQLVIDLDATPVIAQPQRSTVSTTAVATQAGVQVQPATQKQRKASRRTSRRGRSAAKQKVTKVAQPVQGPTVTTVQVGQTVSGSTGQTSVIPVQQQQQAVSAVTAPGGAQPQGGAPKVEPLATLPV